MNNETRRSCQVALDGYRGRFFGSPCVPSPVSGIRTPNLPLLPVWEKGLKGGDLGRFQALGRVIDMHGYAVTYFGQGLRAQPQSGNDGMAGRTTEGSRIRA